jgi:hypothetical protein
MPSTVLPAADNRRRQASSALGDQQAIHWSEKCLRAHQCHPLASATARRVNRLDGNRFI